MVTLLLLRHGEAAQGEERADHNRPLTPSGKRAAELIGHRLRDEDLVPDQVLSSSALRAKDTARRVAAAAKFGGVLDELDELYLAEPADYITAVKRVAVDAERVLVVGHNPGLEVLAFLLTGEPVALRPAGLVVCELPISNFSELSLGVRGEMTRFERPRDDED